MPMLVVTGSGPLARSKGWRMADGVDDLRADLAHFGRAVHAFENDHECIAGMVAQAVVDDLELVWKARCR